MLISSCGKPLKTYQYVSPVDTKSKVIEYQEKQVYTEDDVYASNDFPAARLNDFERIDDTTFMATILPENFPINPSPWYAFKLWSEKSRTINVVLNYPGSKHRYVPKLSQDGENWTVINGAEFKLMDNGNSTLELEIGKDTLWVAAQEIHDTKKVGHWVNSFNSKSVAVDTFGKSAQGRPLFFMNITNDSNKKKPAVIVISRQHPPEVTGYLAMKSFINTIVKEGISNGFLDKYRVLVYPLLNPDGVDLGHFRHNTGGVDLNRDWSVYNQPEISQITKHMVMETRSAKNDVVLGLDFHSTYEDIYYTPHHTIKRDIQDFKDIWLEDIRKVLDLESINDSPGMNERPTSGAWFNRQFNATGITYEIGDNTPRDFISKKGEVSARAMMDYFLKL